MMFLSFCLGNYIADNFIAKIWTLDAGVEFLFYIGLKPSHYIYWKNRAQENGGL